MSAPARHIVYLTLVLFSLLPKFAGAELAWPSKTGPRQNGVADEKHSANLLTRWDERSNLNIAWKTKIQGIGHSTPVIGNGKIWFTSATEDGTQQFIHCRDTASGKQIHYKLLFANESPEPLGNSVNSYASPSCFLTPESVYVHFGSYGTAKLDATSGKVIWQRRDIECRHFRGPASSPVLHDNLLILTFDGIDQQFLLALDTNTGKTVWRTDRTTDYGDLDRKGNPIRDGDMRKAFSTPAIATIGDQTQVVSVGSRAAFGYDAEDGREIWTIRHDDYNAAAQPLLFGNAAILNTGSRGANLLSVKLTQSTKGDVTSSHVVWNREKGNARLCFPVLHRGHIYSLTDNGVMACISAQTGAEVWSGRIGGNFVASPIIAQNRIYVFDERGRGTVLACGDTFEIIAKNRLSEGGKASPAVVGGAIILRTSQHLYKLANQK